MNCRNPNRLVDWISVASIVVSVAAIVVTLKLQTPSTPNSPTILPLPSTQPPAPLTQPKKIPLYFFSQEGCVPCRQLKQALALPALQKCLEHYEVKYLDAHDSSASLFGVQMVPTLVAITPQGVRRKAGYQGEDDLALWLEQTARTQPLTFGKLERGGDTGPKGQQVQADLPVELRLHNTGGNDNPPPYFDNPRHLPGHGSGLCVWTSINHEARRQNVRELWDLQEKMTHQAGGGWPERVDKKLAEYAPRQPFVNYESRDPSLLELALLTGRMPAVTYNGHDRALGGHYPSVIAHVVNLVYLDDNAAAILDNNFEREILWMSRQEFLSRWTGKGNGWAVVLLAPRPPPVPHN